MNKIKIISWNVNGIRAVLKKGFLDFLHEQNPDILCLQEIKANKEQVDLKIPNYHDYWNSATKKGYSGTAIFSKVLPKKVINTFKIELLDEQGRNVANEGRVLTCEYQNYYLVNVYTPNSKGDLSRLSFRHKTWDPTFLKYIKKLEQKKSVIFCGDLNVAHKEIDLARPKENIGKHGFTNEEREGFDNIINSGFVDTFRIFNSQGGNYTWWTPWAKSRERNIGWRIDYFCVSKKISENVINCEILSNVFGSDHCPISLTLKSA